MAFGAVFISAPISHPSSVGLSERYVQMIISALRKHCIAAGTMEECQMETRLNYRESSKDEQAMYRRCEYIRKQGQPLRREIYLHGLRYMCRCPYPRTPPIGHPLSPKVPMGCDHESSTDNCS